MRFFYDEKELSKNPQVYKVDQWKLTLRTDFRIELFKLWRNGEMEEIEKSLKDNGFVLDVVGADFGNDLITSFKNSGYPLHKSDELTFCPDRLNEHPLIRSGKFEVMERRCALQIKPEFERELFSRYPEVSVEEGLKLAGIAPEDVGYQRIRRLMKSFEEKASRMYMSAPDKEAERDEAFETRDIKEGCADLSILKHPYVRDYDGVTVTLEDSFYNEAYLIADVGFEQLAEVYELPMELFDSRNRMVIGAKLFHWKSTAGQTDGENEQVCRIWRKRLCLYIEKLEENFDWMRGNLLDMDISQKRRLVTWIDHLPRDPWGNYTIRRILTMIGMAKSTYYELLRNEEYGNGYKRRAIRDDEDILLIRQVAEYKGYKKGYRQISMMMEDVTGKIMSQHRVLYLMRKYGMRTNIRRPSKNRKAMKELMTKNGKPNLLMRRFRLHRPNEVRLTDVTYLDYGENLRAYGSASIDPVTGKLICFVISENNDLRLALDTLEAMDSYPLKSGGIIHSDQGILYFTDDFQTAVAERDLVQSMSRRGNCWDNAPQESFFGHFKDECDYKKCHTLKELQAQTDDYRVYYNEKRRLFERMKMTPTEYEEYLESLDDKAFKEYIKKEEALYLKKKEKSAQTAVEKAKRHRKEIKDRLEEIENETGGKKEV